ncbi:MAG: S9 family peptidase, partial [Steroidobacteraceae bacterium]|nr:S9 family peptidase [Steroidobacteraceae bacterium]MDW8260860.1 S9 family peptidase [Gammaproteobacteria bacterium]
RGGFLATQDRIIDRLREDREHVLIMTVEEGKSYPSVSRLNVYTGRLQLVQSDRPPISSWVTDGSGVLRFASGATDKRGVYLARRSAHDSGRTLAEFDILDRDHWSPHGFSADPSKMIIEADHNGRRALFEMDLEQPDRLQLLYAHPNVDVGGLVYWPGTTRIVGVAYETDRLEIHFFDSQAAAVQRAIDAALPGRVNFWTGASRDASRMLVVSYSDVQPPRYYVFEKDAAKLVAIGDFNAKLRNRTLAPMRAVKVPGPGGVEIPGYLTVPVGRDAKNLPAVVMPHGGPYARDSWGFDPWLQLVVNRGYAVLQLNYRGSTGYGKDWFEAGYRGWGTVMHDDITAGARWLIAQGIADPQRLCIVGASYGGYAALLGGVKEPDLYRCVVAIAPVTDLAILQKEAERGGRLLRRVVRDLTGTADLAAQSPRRRAAEMRAPVLMVHGTHDVNVAVDHAEIMARELKRAGKSVELIIVPKADHYFPQNPAFALTVYQATERFLAANLGQKIAN